MWSTPKPGHEMDRLRDCRSILDSMTKTQVLYITSHFLMHVILILDYFYMLTWLVCRWNGLRTWLLQGHCWMSTHAPPSSGVSLALIVEVHFPERTVRQVGFMQAIPPVLWDLPRLYDQYTVPTPWALLLRLCTWRHGVGSPVVPALVIRHIVGHLFHQRLILVTLTGSEYAPAHTSSPAKNRVSVLVQLKADWNT